MKENRNGILLFMTSVLLLRITSIVSHSIFKTSSSDLWRRAMMSKLIFTLRVLGICLIKAIYYLTIGLIILIVVHGTSLILKEAAFASYVFVIVVSIIVGSIIIAVLVEWVEGIIEREHEKMVIKQKKW